MPSKRMGTARAFVDHYATNQIEILQSLLAGGLAYTFSPSRSLDNAENLDKAGYIGFRQVMAAATTGYPLQVIKYIESESSNMVIVWATGQPQFREELKDYEEFPEDQWNYTGEFIFMLTMNDSGEKITKVNGFIDSKGTDLKLWPLARRALTNLEKVKQASGN